MCVCEKTNTITIYNNKTKTMIKNNDNNDNKNNDNNSNNTYIIYYIYMCVFYSSMKLNE